MLLLSRAVHVYVATAPCNLKKSFEGLTNEVRQLVARNKELERKLGGKMKSSEGVSSAQLKMLLDEATAAGDEQRQQADEKLREKSGIDEVVGNLETDEPPKRPSLRKPAPPHLRRVPNPLTVPPAERRCPKCGAERQCIGHDTTEVIDLIAAEVIVRVDDGPRARR